MGPHYSGRWSPRRLGRAATGRTRPRRCAIDWPERSAGANGLVGTCLRWNDGSVGWRSGRGRNHGCPQQEQRIFVQGVSRHGHPLQRVAVHVQHRQQSPRHAWWRTRCAGRADSRHPRATRSTPTRNGSRRKRHRDRAKRRTRSAWFRAGSPAAREWTRSPLIHSSRLETGGRGMPDE